VGAVEITREETEHGFDVHECSTGPVVSLRLPGGPMAVKMRDGNNVVYAICDETLKPLYVPARSLSELEQRFVLRRLAAK
jgi:hypothetical protein